MKITVFTSNQPRHISLINKLAAISETVYAIQECNTVFPGQVADFFKKSEVMQAYFANVMRAEKKIFGDLSFFGKNVKLLPIKSGDLNFLSERQLSEALDSDVFIVFGASYIKGWLIDFLVGKEAINIHMGLSPFYRGSSCNFWAVYDGRPELVGATIHMLSKGLDSGPMLFHALPLLAEDADPFEFTMKAVDVAQTSLVERIESGEIRQFERVPQDRALEIRYTRNMDFNDDVALRFLQRNIGYEELKSILDSVKRPTLLMPFYA
ncbi:methionyl-tRNA formyltransferase [Herbaspirillum sp. CF444]|uniref:formyltransferase family protein n=1 Tax=Herbaspirillum sp. CF444 TaxID=1144319 RepID=UPI0002724027|nr:formyltransferase family protein [Herbaspirillum sp. CF444]EJL88301.1 methionyl-tRNA formyltransferase [Herbaspirillum sp. CF444]